jgi:hypothetical protein
MTRDYADKLYKSEVDDEQWTPEHQLERLMVRAVSLVALLAIGAGGDGDISWFEKLPLEKKVRAYAELMDRLDIKGDKHGTKGKVTG